MNKLKFLKETLILENGYISNTLLDNFLEKGETILLNPKEDFISQDSIDTNVWIQVNGIAKAYYFNGQKEIVLGFASTGTITLSPLSYFLGERAFCAFQAVTKCEMIKISKKDVEKLLFESHEFAIWMFRVALSQFCGFELKIKNFSERDSKEIYKSLIKKKMQIGSDRYNPSRLNFLSSIPSKDLASYMGITQSYLSNIRKIIIKEEKNNNKNLI